MHARKLRRSCVCTQLVMRVHSAGHARELSMCMTGLSVMYLYLWAYVYALCAGCVVCTAICVHTHGRLMAHARPTEFTCMTIMVMHANSAGHACELSWSCMLCWSRA